MFRSIPDRYHHFYLCDAIKASQLPTTAEQGFCFGYALVAMFAVLLRDTASFDRRAHIFSETPVAGIIKQMNAVMWGPAEDISPWVTKDHQFWVNMHAYLTNVAILQKCGSYMGKNEFTGLFENEKGLDQSNILEKKSDIFLPQALQDQGCVKRVGKFYGVYEINELKSLLQSLHKALVDAHIDFPVTFLLGNLCHVMTLGFDPAAEQWVFMEVSYGETQLPDHARVAEMVNRVFSDNKNTAMSVEVFATGKHAVKARQVLQQWQSEKAFMKCHDLTKQRVELQDSHHVSLLSMAVEDNDARQTTAILQRFPDMATVQNETGATPIYRAVLYNSVDCLTEMNKLKNVGINLPNKLGITPLHLTLLLDNMQCCEKLLQHSELDVNETDAVGRSPLESAINKDKPDFVRLLLAHPKLQFPKTMTLMIAVRNNQFEI